MLKLAKVAITGGIASGKSSVCRVFQELGAFVVNADDIVHELLLSLSQQVVHLLGSEVLGKDGKLNRRAIAEKVFKNPEALHELENILHPAVLREIENLYQTAEKRQSAAFVVEMPLLFEIGQESYYDYVIAVVSDESLARKRFIQSGFDKKEYDQRMNRQMDITAKAKRADFIITNNGSHDDLRRQVTNFYHQHLLKGKHA